MSSEQIAAMDAALSRMNDAIDALSKKKRPKGVLKAVSAAGCMNRRVKLQINQRGAWRDVMCVETSKLDSGAFLKGAAAMVRASGNMDRTFMRIVTDDSPPVRMMNWNAADGWVRHAPASTA